MRAVEITRNRGAEIGDAKWLRPPNGLVAIPVAEEKPMTILDA